MKKNMVIFVTTLLALVLAACSGRPPAAPGGEASNAGTSAQVEEAPLPDATETMEDTAVQTITLDIGGTLFTANLYDSDTVSAFTALLPLTLAMGDFNQNEKVAALPQSLPTDAYNPGTVHTGDLMLYGSDRLVLFYETFPTSYSYTPIATIEDASGLAALVGSGSIEATFAAG